MDTSADANSNINPAILIVLCGLVGSGKSGFATALQREFPEICRCNQDELGKRQDVEREVNAVLSRGLSVCVDRVNFDPSQRRPWIDIARRYPGVEIWCLEMKTPYDVCYARVLERKDHPTLKTPEQAVGALRRFRSNYVTFNVSEGFNRVYRIKPHNSPEYTREDVERVLAATRKSHYFPSPDSLPPVPPPSDCRRRPFPIRGHRGRGAPNSRGRGSHHASSPGGPDSPDMPSWQSGDNWRTQDSVTSTYRGRGHSSRGWSRSRGWGGYRGRGGLSNNLNPNTGSGDNSGN